MEEDLLLARIDDYREAFRLACQELATVNLHRICSLSGAVCIEDKNGNPAISIPFINREYLIHFEPEVDVFLKGNGEPVPIQEKILILHYLLTARGESMQLNPITFRQVTEGSFYYSAFSKRALDPLTQTFGGEPQVLLDCGSKLGAVASEFGDASITLKPLPRVSVTFVIWGGDGDLLRSYYPQPHLATPDPQDGDFDVVPDGDTLAQFPGQNQHDFLWRRGSSRAGRVIGFIRLARPDLPAQSKLTDRKTGTP